MLKDTKLNDTEQQILSYLEFHSDQILDIRIQKVAEDNYTSTSTVFRLAKKMGFSGYKELTYYFPVKKVFCYYEVIHSKNSTFIYDCLFY